MIRKILTGKAIATIGVVTLISAGAGVVATSPLRAPRSRRPNRPRSTPPALVRRLPLMMPPRPPTAPLATAPGKSADNPSATAPGKLDNPGGVTASHDRVVSPYACRLDRQPSTRSC